MNTMFFLMNFISMTTPSTKRKAYMVKDEVGFSNQAPQNGFVYIEFTNDKGQTSKGWVKESDLEWWDE